MFDSCKAYVRELRAVFGRADQRLDEGIVVTDSWSGLGGAGNQSCQHRNHRIETLEQRLAVLENAQQLPLSAMSSGDSPATTTKLRTVSEHTRRVQQKDEVGEADSVPFFDETRVPVEAITVSNPHTQGLTPDQYEVISAKVTYRLAQRPGSYVMLKYVREVIKLKQTQAIHCPPAPVGVLKGSRADVSFLAGLLLEEFTYYAPLYRQHQRLQDNSIRVTRP